MKNMILILSMFFFITGCSEKETKQQETSIYGTWQLVNSYVVDGFSGSWISVNNGFTIMLKRDNTFSSTKYQECSEGSYFLDLSSEKIILEYNCANFNPCENSSSKCVERFEFDGKLLKLIPEYSACIEGCGEKFKKIE